LFYKIHEKFKENPVNIDKVPFRKVSFDPSIYFVKLISTNNKFWIHTFDFKDKK